MSTNGRVGVAPFPQHLDDFAQDERVRLHQGKWVLVDERHVEWEFNGAIHQWFQPVSLGR